MSARAARRELNAPSLEGEVHRLACEMPASVRAAPKAPLTSEDTRILRWWWRGEGPQEGGEQHERVTKLRALQPTPELQAKRRISGYGEARYEQRVHVGRS